MDYCAVEVEWKQPSRQVLFADAAGTEAARKRGGQLAPALGRNLRDCEAQGGLNMTFPRWFYTLPLRLRSLFRREQVDQELRDELRDHLEQQINENLARGMSPEEARYAALRALGGITQIEQQCRDARGGNVMADLL